jgi:hypothetical protein
LDAPIREHDVVVLLRGLPEEGLAAGRSGTAVYVHRGGIAFEVEFPNPAGRPRFIVATVAAEDLRRVGPGTGGASP